MAEKKKYVKKRIIGQEEKDIIATAVDRAHRSQKSLAEIYEFLRKDLRFRNGEHWPEKIKKSREDAGLPCLVINKIPAITRQITNDHKQNRMAMKFRPVGDGADVETAEILDGLARRIWRHSDGDAATDVAEWYAVNGSIGYFRMRTKYCDSTSFKQDVVVDSIDDPTSVLYPIHFLKKEDFSDMPYAFIVDDYYPKKDFEENHPDIDMVDFKAADKNIQAAWVHNDCVRIAEYYEVVYDTSTLYLLSDESTTNDASNLPEGITVANKRTVRVPRVLWRKICGVAILEGGIEGQEIPTVDDEEGIIPIITIMGEKMKIDGKVILDSAIKHVKDAALAKDYWKTKIVECLGLAALSPYIGYEGQFEGHEQEWDNANRLPYGRLEVKPTTIDGKPAPLPRREQPPQIPTGFVEGMREAIDDEKNTSGMFDAALGATGNETSGIAINQRKMQSGLSNYHFTDSLARALRLAGRIFLCMRPKVYDTARTLQIIGIDNESKMVKVNQQTEDATNEKGNYEISTGKYGVDIDVGPSYATQRQMIVDQLMEFIGKDPQIAIAIGDIVARNMDFPGSKELSDRLKRMVPQGLIDDPKNGKIDPQMVQKMGMALQESQAKEQDLLKIIGKMQDEIDSKEKDRELEVDKALLLSETSIEIAQIKATMDKVNQNHDLLMKQIELMAAKENSPLPVESTENTPSGEMSGVTNE